MNIELTGKSAVVTGGSRGIGLAIGARLLEAGANVLLTSRSEQNLAEATASLDQYGSRVGSLAAHVGRSDDANRVAQHAVERFGSLDILVNNAGTNPYFGPLVDIDDVRMQKTFEINQASIVTHTRAAWHAWMKENGGAILNVASIGGYGPEPGIGWYNVTKAAVIHLTKQFAYELAPTVRVNAIAPGLVKTELARGLWEPNEQRIAAHIPMRRLGEPDDIATAALFLLSNEASWLTGQTLIVDGGSTNQPSGGVG
jgi:NAD(P)-dependent dehydrogenase (short-subunit alcohol dehydrogenase family)